MIQYLFSLAESEDLNKISIFDKIHLYQCCNLLEMQTMVVKLLVNAPSVSSKRDLKLSGYQESKSC